ncbi:MAG: hypothetical protein HY000_30665 [Planctomycetes bacterium]|nr:hypothetical protein [Planctomycetota bacterium]
MTGRLIPPPELAPTVPAGLTPEQRIMLWVDLMNASEQFLLAGLRHKIGPDGDLKAAYREWVKRWGEEHDRTMFHMLKEFDRRLYGGG